MLSDLTHWKTVWTDAMFASVIHGVSNTRSTAELRAFRRRMSRLEGSRFAAYPRTHT